MRQDDGQVPGERGKRFADTVADALANAATAPETAITLFERALSMRDVGDGIAHSHHQMGLCLASVGMSDQAIDRYRLALTLGMAEFFGRCLADLGAALRAIGDFAQSQVTKITQLNLVLRRLKWI